jgi:hypothetical protein
MTDGAWIVAKFLFYWSLAQLVLSPFARFLGWRKYPETQAPRFYIGNAIIYGVTAGLIAAAAWAADHRLFGLQNSN